MDEKDKKSAQLVKKINVSEEKTLPDDQAIFAEGVAQRIIGDDQFVDKIAEATKAKIADLTDHLKKIEDELAIVKEVAETQRRHSTYQQMKHDNDVEDELGSDVEGEDE